MRIWSLHSRYLDAKGLVALWRETLLARKVLENKTKGYKNHPQLDRFKSLEDPISAINYYLKFVWEEAHKRNYNFDKDKLGIINNKTRINVTSGQIDFEKTHLLSKLKQRDKQMYYEYTMITNFDVHPVFNLIDGNIEAWEKN